MCHKSHMAMNVWHTMFTLGSLPLIRFQCSYGACGRSTVVLSSKLTSLSSNLQYCKLL